MSNAQDARGGGTRTSRHTGMYHSNGSLFQQEIPKHGVHFLQKHLGVLRFDLDWGVLLEP